MEENNHNVQEAEMSFLDHVEVLRWHLIRSLVAILFFAIIAFLNKRILFDLIIFAPKNADFATYKVMCQISKALQLGETICIREIPFALINTPMSGQFTMHILASVVAGLVLAFPYVMWEVWKFISPALHRNEKKSTRGMVAVISFLFATGVFFGYYMVAPLSINFLGTYHVSNEVQNMIDMTSYISLVVTIILATGIVFQMPVVVYFLTKLGVITPQTMKLYRKHALIGALVLSAVITPPDVSSQILVAIPLIVLYEISIWISRMVSKSMKIETP